MNRLTIGVVLVVPLSFWIWPAPATGVSGAEMLPIDITLENTSPYYQPQQATVWSNAPVRWLNATASAHSVRHDGCLTDELCAFQSIAVPPDSSFAIAPLPPGRYSYHCELHPIMRGTLIVVEPVTHDHSALRNQTEPRM